jgi:hypothetical protein
MTEQSRRFAFGIFVAAVIGGGVLVMVGAI